MQVPLQVVKPPAGRARAARWSWLRLAATGVLAVLLLGGCVVRVVYNQLDWLALWYVEDYFDLDPAQAHIVKAVKR